ncbi:MAG: hypothetical protein JWQ04_158 [Pedosphaera sp.]|nr:hypothetical protein [Pedosphaera sp.]
MNQTLAQPFRLRLAQGLCRPLPPLLAQRLRSFIYPLPLAYRDDFAFTVRSQTGSMFRSRTSDFHGYPFSVQGYYEWRNWAIARALCSAGDTIIEIGANIGTETIGFRDIVGGAGKVFAFEPLPANIRALQQVLILNGCHNVSVLPLALGSKPGRVKFVPPDKPGASGIGHLARNPAANAGGLIEVECATLDSLATTLGAARMIFIDAEGAETAVLDGAKNYLARHQPVIVLEASPKLLARAGSSLEELQRKLATHRYETFVISRFGLRPVNESQPPAAHSDNWLCLPAHKRVVLPRVRRFLFACGLLPCIARLNPMKWARA